MRCTAVPDREHHECALPNSHPGQHQWVPTHHIDTRPPDQRVHTLPAVYAEFRRRVPEVDIYITDALYIEPILDHVITVRRTKVQWEAELTIYENDKVLFRAPLKDGPKARSFMANIIRWMVRISDSRSELLIDDLKEN